MYFVSGCETCRLFLWLLTFHTTSATISDTQCRLLLSLFCPGNGFTLDSSYTRMKVNDIALTTYRTNSLHFLESMFTQRIVDP